MTIQKKSLISTLNTTKKATVASNQAGTVSVTSATKSPVKTLAARKAAALRMAKRDSLARR